MLCGHTETRHAKGEHQSIIGSLWTPEETDKLIYLLRNDIRNHKYYTEAPGLLYNLPFYILTSVPFALRSHDNILIDISEGRRLIIGTASHLPTYQWYYARVYSPHDPRSVRRLSCKSANNYLPHQWRRRQDLFASQRHCLWYWACH